MTCYECRKYIAENEGEENVSSKDDEEEGGTGPKQGCEKTEKDDEEEWGRIPIPQSDDTDESEDWTEPEHREDDTGPTLLNSRKPDDDPDDASANLTFLAQRPSCSPDTKEQEKMSIQNINDYAFLIGPRRDGLIQRKDGTILTLQELSTTLNLLHQTVLTSLETVTLNSPYPISPTKLPSWTAHLMCFQRSALKMSYKNKSKMRSKLMKSIQKAVPTQGHVHWYPTKSNHINVQPWRSLVSNQVQPYQCSTVVDLPNSCLTRTLLSTV